MAENYGATAEEWTVLSETLGLVEDLLPVVANPKAEISPKSTMKNMGKTPSWYNAQRKVAGISDWTSKKSTPAEINKWSKEPDYGICIQTRNIRALDLDVPETNKVGTILNFIDETLRDLVLPIRQRPNSGKCLLAFRLAGSYAKRRFKVDGGIIEYLADGQQFVALGTHPSGVRYTWDWCDNNDFPELSGEQFETLWQALIDKFAIAEPTTGGVRQIRPTFIIDDPTVGKLDVLGWGPDGQAHIECPFAGEHTSDSGVSSTSYFPKGTNGYEQGHFVCLHAHCAHRTDGDFLNALGFISDEFDVLPPETAVDNITGEVVVVAERPKFKRDKAGVLPTIDNLCIALIRPDVCDARIAYDSFRDEVVITSTKTNALTWQPLGDNDYTLLQRHLERCIGFKPIAIDLMRRAVNLVAYENTFDSAQIWLNSLKWDGVERINTFMARYMGSKNDAYGRAVSRYLWSAMAGRVLVPGVKADMVPIFESGQGTIKSTSVAALAPDPEYFVEINFNENESDLARKMRGKMVGEISELRGLHTRDLETIKAFVTRTHEQWVPKYMEKTKTLPRRLIFIGTTNQKEILADDSGNRRWLPIRVEKGDIEAIKRDRDQLWAEARHLFLSNGVCFTDAEKLSPDMHLQYGIQDPWEDFIFQWANTVDEMGGGTPLSRGFLMMSDILQHALHIDVKNIKGQESKRIAKILRGRGFERVRIRIGNDLDWVWKIVDDGSELV